MELLKSDIGEFYRVKRGQTASEIEKTLKIPVNSCFAGAIIPVVSCSVYTVQPFETYASLAKKHGMDEEKLKAFNGGRPLYPTCKIFIPAGHSEKSQSI